MKSKKITAWLVLVAMLMSLMPTTVLGALADEYYPIIITDVFSEMTNDIDGVQHGTDLDLVGATNEILPDFKNTSDVLTDTLDGVSGTVLHKADKDTNSADGEVKLAPMRRKQILTFVAESHADNAEFRKFVDESTSTGISAGAVEIAYLDADKAPLKVDVESEEGKDFVVGKATTWDEAWIDLTTDVQRTNVNLKTFLNPDPSEPQYDLRDATKTTLINTKKLTAADLFATGDKISFIIYNAVKGDFSGYIRVKIKDNAGYTTVQDYAIVADGQYPSISIKTSTYKNNVGEYTMVPDALNPAKLVATTVAYNTFIAEDDFATIMEDTADNKAENEMDNLKKSYRWKKLDSDSLNATLKDIAEGKDSEYEGKKYEAEKIWAMDEIVIDKIAVSDELITSEIDTVKYTLKKFSNDEITNVVGSSTEGITDLTFEPDALAAGKVWNITSDPIVVSDEGFNVLAITATDKAGLKTTSRYYFYIDTKEPVAEFSLVELDKNVISLLTAADVVTNRQQAVDIEAFDLVGSDNVKVISGVAEAVEGEENLMYQYRLLATKTGEVAKDTDGDGEKDVPEGYTEVVLDKKGNDLSGWKIWTGETETPIIDKEFDGIVQVRVQDRAGNWTPIVSVTNDGEETIITDNTNPVIDVKEYALNSNADATGNTADEIINGTATDILVTTARVTEKTDGEIENEVIHTITGDVAPWINDSAVMAVKITDEDLINAIRSSGLEKGQITVNAEFNKENQNKEIKIWKKDGSQPDTEDPGLIGNSVEFEIAKEHIFGDDDSTLDYNEADKALTFYLEYEGTGAVDITVSIKDQADVNDGDDFTVIYKTQLRVDKINPYIIYKGYDITDADKTDLLKANTAKVDYEVRNMPWGPNSQVLEVVVKDDDITPVQSKTKNIKFCTNKAIDLYKVDGATFTKVKTYAAGNDNIVSLSDCEELANEKYESNVGYKFYLVYEGTGIAKVEFYAEDSATEPNVRNYPSVATAADAEPVLYDAMLRVDKINPEIKNAKLVQTDADVEDKGWFFNLFTFNKTDVDVNTRKQMKITFEVVDETTTTEQSGVNIQNEKISGVDLIDVYDKYVEKDKTHLYDNEATAYMTDDANDVAVDPNIDYILLPVEAGEINGTGGTFTEAASASNKDIEALVAEYLDKEYNEDGDKCEWKKASWKDGGIVVPDEFQGAIVLRTIDRVGNIDYSEPITFVAESREALIDFDPQNGYIWSQNNYGWSKRDYDYVEIRVKDDNEGKVDAWLENVFISVTDLEGNDISANDSVKYSYPNIHANDANLEVDPSGYTYVSLTEFANEAAYGYDVISKDGLVEKLARDEEGYIHLGYVRVAESAQIKVTIFDKAKANDVEYTGNKTTGIWTSRIDRVAPVVTEFDLVPVYQGDASDANNNGYALKVKAEDKLSGMAPDITEAEYNVYTPENIPVTGVFNTDASYLYKITNDADVEIERYNSGTFNAGQYEMPGLQYALIPGNGDLEDVAPWNFEADPSTIYDENGYNGEMGKPYVWHNYIDDKTPMIPDDFDGLIVVRAIDKAGNITVVGYSSILDVEADDDWHNETQYIQVRTDNKWDDGTVVNVQYYGNNNLLFPVDMRKDLSNSLNNGEGAVIEIAEEGITNVVITATEEFAAAKTAKANKDKRNADWEGDMYIGNATTAGYQDWKFQVVDVKIDKQAPSVRMTLTDKDGNVIEDDAVEGTVKIEANIFDPIPNIPDELGYRSHIPSEVIKVEWCAIPEGSEEENWIFATDWENGNIGTFDADAFTGTIKVRAIDNAGNVTEKSQRLNVDGVNAIINLSKSHDDIYSLEPVDVFVTVTENAEFSDVAEVTYEVTDEEGNLVECDALTLIGGTVSVDREGTTKVKVTATTKAGVKVSKEIIVKIDRTAPTFDMDVVDSKGSVNNRTTNEDVTIKALDVKDATSGVAKVEYAVIPEGSLEENYVEFAAAYEALYKVEEAFTGTVNVRVTDKAGHVTVKSMKINIDKKAPLVVISKSNEEDYSKENVNVFVTVTENAEYSDVASVEYEVTNPDGTYEKGTLALTGGTISVTEEGTTKIVVIAKTKAGVEATAETTVLIDKTAPTFDMDVVDTKGSVADRTTNEDVTIKALDVKDATSGVAKVEYAVIPEGSLEENYVEFAAAYEALYEVEEAFTGTVNVRVTDKAGHVTVKSMKINIDKKAPLVTITKAKDGECSHESVNVFVTVSNNAEYSDVTSVEYVVTNDGKEIKGNLALTGGTIFVDAEGESKIVVTAKTKAGVEATAETTVKIHYGDLKLPTLNGVKSGSTEPESISSNDWVIKNELTVSHNNDEPEKTTVEYTLNGSDWNKVTNNITGLKPGENIVRVRVLRKGCLCKSDVNTFVVNYEPVDDADAKKPSLVIPVDTNSRNTAKVILLVPDKGGYASDIKSVTYKFGKDATAEYSLPVNGGSIVVSDEGEWIISGYTITMESGEVITWVAPERKDAKVVANIDKTAPEFLEGTELEKTEEELDSAGSLFGYAVVANGKLKLKVMAKDNRSDYLRLEYALMEKGMTEPKWNSLTSSYQVETSYTSGVIVTTDFDGFVLVKATDQANNSTVISLPVIADANIPQISITTPASDNDWLSEDATVTIDVIENGVSAGIAVINYIIKKDGKEICNASTDKNNTANLTTKGGQMIFSEEGEYELIVTAVDAAGNKSQEVNAFIRIDKTAPTYSGSVTPSLFNIHRINNWDDIHDGWTYNHAVDISGIVDNLSGIKEIKVTAITETGNTISTVLDSTATGTSFDTDGTYALEITDNAGNVRNLTFVINKKLTNVINVVGVDEYGKVNVAVTDGDERLSFYSVEDEVGAADIKLHNGVTNQLWDGRTGIRYIYGKNDSGKITNKLHVFVAPSNEYDISLSTFMDSAATSAPNRFVDIDAEGANVKVTQVDKLFAPGILKDVQTGSSVKINEDGVYSIITNN